MVRRRPEFLLALGGEPLPTSIEVGGDRYALIEPWKHDSWAATAVYGRGAERIVCKFHRTAPWGPIPMRWLGRYMAWRETWFLRRLSSVRGIPAWSGPVCVAGRVCAQAVAHTYIDGTPLSLLSEVDACYFQRFEALLAELHARRVAYVDLHKAENALVGVDGWPYLIDFQISVWLPPWAGFSGLFAMLCASDRYHLLKHHAWRSDRARSDEVARAARPWWINAHRALAVPLRQLRRRLLVALRVRAAGGAVESESEVEPGKRRAA